MKTKTGSFIQAILYLVLRDLPSLLTQHVWREDDEDYNELDGKQSAVPKISKETTLRHPNHLCPGLDLTAS